MTLSFNSNGKPWGLLSLVVAIAVSSVDADTASSPVSPLLSLLRKNYSAETTLSTKFTQTIYWSVREKEEKKKKGSICLAPKDRFRVTIGSETFVSSGETFWQHSAGTNQVVIKKLADVDRSAFPSEIFARYLSACPFREVGRKKDVVLFSWKSDSVETLYREIQVAVKEKAGLITRCVMTDHNGNIFTYAFSATVFGEKFPRERFEFNAPENARIVDMRQ
jgi:outer membrane lipoprotein-sorting protein